MPDFLKRFDDSGRSARAAQVKVLDWINDTWSTPKTCIQAPVGLGKSAVTKAVSVVTNAHIITPSNVLIDQYTDTYPEHNALKGKIHYPCHASTYSCQEWQDQLQMKACDNCPYALSKKAAVEGQPTFFNPMSLYYATADRKWKEPSVILVDEAHQLGSMLLMMSGAKFRYSEYRWPSTVLNERDLVSWLDGTLQRLQLLLSTYKKAGKGVHDTEASIKIKHIAEDIGKLRLTRDGFYENPQNYATWIEPGTYRGRPDKFLHIKPLTPPRYLVNQILSSRKVILMSGTLFETDIKDLLGDENYKFLDVESPIPKQNRQVYYEPMVQRMNRDTDPKTVVDHLVKLVDKHDRPNTIIHVSYSWSVRLQPYLTERGWLFNTSSNKEEVLDRFKRDGGVFVAAGCAEGIDLKGDLCRLNIIPFLLFPNLADPVVKKRKALQDGERWYALETMKALLQQTGRSTRSPEDWSKTIVLDNNFSRIYSKVSRHLPKSFVESIVWRAA